jgi:hypothetical protein
MDQGKLNPGERIDQLRNEAKNPNRSMLRHTHFGTKGGNRTFAALCTDVFSADKPAFC